MGEVRFMISEAAKKVQVESHVLRYWEEELHIPIGRTEMGHRYYTEDDIQLFCCIKRLKDEGMLLRDLKLLIPQLNQYVSDDALHEKILCLKMYLRFLLQVPVLQLCLPALKYWHHCAVW